MNLQKIADLLKSDPSVDASTVVVNEEDGQVEFYTKGDHYDPYQEISFDIQMEIEKLGGFVHMNDCEGFFNEGVVWPKL